MLGCFSLPDSPPGSGPCSLPRGGRPSGPALGTGALLGGCRSAGGGAATRGRAGLTRERPAGRRAAPFALERSLDRPGALGRGFLVGLRQSDGDGLLARARTVLALAHVVHLLPYELAGLRARRLALPSIFPGPFNRLLLRHGFLLSRGRAACDNPVTLVAEPSWPATRGRTVAQITWVRLPDSHRRSHAPRLKIKSASADTVPYLGRTTRASRNV
jgi:hypothetical protein